MGQRGEVFSTRIFVNEGRKTFFFNVKENRYHDIYLNIAESRKTDRGFRRSSIVVFQEDIDPFLRVLDTALNGMRKRQVDEILTVGHGRRQYRFRGSGKNRGVLQIVETREDESGYRREGIYLDLAYVDMFMKGMGKALSVMKSDKVPTKR